MSSFFSSLTKGLGSIGKGFKNIGKTVLNSFSSTSGLVTGGLGSGYLNNLGDTITSGLGDFWEQYTGADVAKANLKAQEAQWQKQNSLNERQFEYQKQLNQLQNQREDTAYQRKVADVTAAGFNPILAASGSGSPSTLGVSPALHTAPAPQRENTSGALRETAGLMSKLVMEAISMKKDFAVKDAQIKLFQAEKDKVDAEAAGIKTENKYKDRLFQAKVDSAELANAYASGTLDSRIAQEAQKVDINERDIILKELIAKWKELDITSKELDNAYARLRNEYFPQEKDLDLAAMSIAVMQKWSEYEAYKFKRSFYEKDFNVPVDFNPSNSYLASLFVGRNGDKVLAFLDKLFGSTDDDGTPTPKSPKSKPPRKFTKAELKELLKRPSGSNMLWTRRMNETGDYGVRRNF